MIFRVEDVTSLSESLSRWESAEYVFAALVAVACAGEYVADFTNWFTGGTEERKKRLAKRSTLLLIVALALELTCLVKTNSLSGLLIGSLSEKAQTAEKDAKEAFVDSGIAERQSAQAAIDAGKANDASSAAKAAASSAINLAHGARQEADSFEKDIASAKKQAAEAESHLAEAMKRAAALTAQLDRLTTPRSLPVSPQIVAALKQFRSTEYMFTEVCADTECVNLLKDIDGVLELAEWKRVKSPHRFPGLVLWGDPKGDDGAGIDLEPGVKVSIESTILDVPKTPLEDLPEYIRAAITLNLTLASNVSPPENTGRLVGVETGSSAVVRISVGRKPLP